MQSVITVRGRVQGVNFRNTVRRYAEKHTLTGWVQNNPEGTVTITARGSEKAVNALQEWVKNSPGFSLVKQISVRPVPEEKFTGFAVRRESFIYDRAHALKNLARNI